MFMLGFVFIRTTLIANNMFDYKHGLLFWPTKICEYHIFLQLKPDNNLTQTEIKSERQLWQADKKPTTADKVFSNQWYNV